VKIEKAGRMVGGESPKMKGCVFPEGLFLERMWANRPKLPEPEKKAPKPKKVVVPKPHIDLSGIYDKVKLTYVVTDEGVKVKLFYPDKWIALKKKYFDKGTRAPIGHVTAAMRSWGCTKEAIEWAVQKHMDNKNDPAWEADFNRFFPAEKKSTTKKKAVKAVVKK
jgi:hypothetical protein